MSFLFTHSIFIFSRSLKQNDIRPFAPRQTSIAVAHLPKIRCVLLKHRNLLIHYVVPCQQIHIIIPVLVLIPLVISNGVEAGIGGNLPLRCAMQIVVLIGKFAP